MRPNDPDIVDIHLAPKVGKVVSLWRGELPIDARWLMPEILEVVASAYGIDKTLLLGPLKTRRVTIPRQHAIWLMCQQPHLSLPMIGRFFGHKDHTSAHHGRKAHAARMAARRYIETERAA